MFPCGHVHYSALATAGASPAQMIGAVLPDANLLKAFTRDDLHEMPNVDDLVADTELDAELSDVVAGVRHHIELDDRAHTAFAGKGGYAFVNQTPELQAVVKAATGLDDYRATGIAHNFLETAVDLHVFAAKPDVMRDLQAAITAYDFTNIGSAIAAWRGTDPAYVIDKTAEYYSMWTRHDLTSIDGFVEVWVELLMVLNQNNFDRPDGEPIDRELTRKGLELSFDITAESWPAVLTP